MHPPGSRARGDRHAEDPDDRDRGRRRVRRPGARPPRHARAQPRLQAALLPPLRRRGRARAQRGRAVRRGRPKRRIPFQRGGILAVPRVFRSLAEWRAERAAMDLPGLSVGFVPTMGALHAGHRSLLERARAENDKVVMSIFVNPAQFDDPADLERYPRVLEADLAVAGGLADCVLVPEAREMYRDDYRYRMTEYTLSARLEGAHRPGHFEGVLTVVLKLLNLVRPHRAYFGEKDRQQLDLVQGMAQALFLPVEIVACPTVRDPDGVALSSRNRRLSPAARSKAAAFPRILRASADAAAAAAEARRILGKAAAFERAAGESLRFLELSATPSGSRTVGQATISTGRKSAWAMPWTRSSCWRSFSPK